jgi:PAS domain S-box-containing protein
MGEERAPPAAQPGNGPPARPDPDPQLFAEQVQLVRRNLPLALLGMLLNAAVLGYVLWPQQPAQPLLIWLGALLAVLGARAGYAALYGRVAHGAAGIRRWAWGYQASVALSGLVWGAAALVLPVESLTDQVFIAFLTGGLAAGATAAYTGLPWLAHAFIVPATGCVALGLLLHGGERAAVMAGMVALFGVLLAVMARGVHQTILASLRLRLQNRGLVDYLSASKAAAERHNADFKLEIGERRLAEQALRESEERFRGLVESATDGIGFTFEGRIYYANQAALDLIGYPPEEVLGLPIENFLNRTTLEKDQIYQRYLDRMEGREVPRQYETQMVRKDGSVVDVMFSNSVVSLDGKQGVMSIVKDITERKKAEEELRVAKETAEEATRLKDQFVSLLAHDLRAPLNSIFSLVALLRGDTGHPLAAEQQRLLRSVAEQGESTLRMIEDLLNVSRLRTGKLKPELRFVDAAAVTANALSLLKPLAAEKRIELRDDVPHRTRIYTDADMLAKVIYNLISNAIKFSRRGGRIRLFVPPGRPTTLAVQDQGVGVDPKLVPNLFGHEVKTSALGTAGERGTGLGLPLSQDLMRALGGEITLEASSEQGSVFYAELPAVRPKVLVVGRDESLRLFVRPHLESIDAEFLGAGDDEEAVRRLEGEAVHLVIAEANLDGNGGLVLLRRIREAPGGKGVPLMLIADKSEAGMLEHGFRMGADDIVVKPLVPDDFLVRLRRFIT